MCIRDRYQRRVRGKSCCNMRHQRTRPATTTEAATSRWNQAKQEERAWALRSVFDLFDLDGSGTLEADELLQLGIARRALGHQKGEWTPEANERLLQRVDKDGDGVVDREEFCRYFAEELPRDRSLFKWEIERFREVASRCRQARHQRRVAALRTVFDELDQMGSGSLEPADLLQLGAGFAALEGGWTVKMNEVLMEQLDADKDGVVGREEFCSYFEALLPKETSSFDDNIQHFMQVASQCRREEVDTPDRMSVLSLVFDEFDLDGSGTLEADEVLQLGIARRTLGHQKGEWTPEANERFMGTLDTDGDGVINREEFCHHFDRLLPRDKTFFEQATDRLMDVARECRRSKQNSAGKSEQAYTDAERVAALRAVFDGFVLDDSGAFGSVNFILLHNRLVRSVHDSWVCGAETNDSLVQRMAADRYARVTGEDFCAYYEERLPRDKHAFDEAIGQLSEAADECQWIDDAVDQFVARDLDRDLALCGLFDQFDLDGSGMLERDELVELGFAQSILGHKPNMATDLTDKLREKLDTNGDGVVSREEFCSYFVEVLPTRTELFRENIREFMRVASLCRRTQLANRVFGCRGSVEGAKRTPFLPNSMYMY
eukprot:TRINITY_DN6653_c0_g1_i1.p1 TRINITY_DN6653_c0_g1~~TRINITY_DN6653_c0_g1_i1.p1  ORF type:complete len:604 (+),score=126.90 TRINITY_DN6653_c0_g1_i1:162-1973(+)